jgi:hypothetical protein
VTTIAESGTPILYGGFEIAVKLADGRVFDYCKRCGGCGQYSFNLQDGTVCYGCFGSGLGKATTEADAIRRAKARKQAASARQRREEKRLADQEADRYAWASEHMALAAALTDLTETATGILHDLANQAAWRPMSPKQTELAERLVAEHREREAKRTASEAATRKAGHLGTVGEKVTVGVTIQFVKSIESSFNGRPTYSWLVVMKTDEGHTLKTFSSGAFGFEVEKGLGYTITGTVKSHDDYNGLPETMLTRCKIVN